MLPLLLYADVVGTPLSIDELAMAFQAVSTLDDKYAKELQLRYGGRVAIGEILPRKDFPSPGYL